MPIRKSMFVLSLTLLLASPFAMAAQNDQSVATVGSWHISMEELDAQLTGQMYEVEQQRFRLRAEKLQQLLEDKLLEMEADAQKITVADLLKKEVESKVPTLDEAKVKEFLEANRARLPDKGKGMESKVREYLTAQLAQEAHAVYLAKLFEKHHAQINLPAPIAPRFEVTGPEDVSKGDPKARVKLIEFSDYQCPYCSRVQDILKKVEKQYGDKVLHVFRNYPLEFHKDAKKASEAALCAWDQDHKKFWEYHDLLYANQDKMGQADLEKYAKDIKIDESRFQNCLKDGKFAQRVAEDIAEGQRLGITGTPTFYINGQKLTGAQPFEAFQGLIDKELESIK
ncbi:MAG: thioredoxin domain-containing protein [Magnetococcus sp. DMHC-6]